MDSAAPPTIPETNNDTRRLHGTKPCTDGYMAATRAPENKKPRYLLNSVVSNACKGLTGGLGRNRTTDTRIFNSD